MLREPKRRTTLALAILLLLSLGLSLALPACQSDPQEALILDIFDLIDRYYIAKVDRRELTGSALKKLVDYLQAEVRMEAQTEEMKKFLKARENGEELSPTPLEEVSPTPIPTPYDEVKIDVTPTSVAITANGQTFARELPFDKKKLAAVMLDGVRFYQQTLGLKRPLDELLQLALDGMVQALDPHSGFLNLSDYNNLKQDTEGSFGGVGIEIGIRDGFLTVISPMAGTPAERAGLQAMDRIVGIDGVDTTGQSLNWAVLRLRGKIGTPVTMSIKRPGKEDHFDVTIVRDKIEAVATKHEMWPGNVGYVRLIQFNARTSADLDLALAEFSDAPGGLRALVIDLRNNPGGLLEQTVDVADKFLPGGLIVNTIGRGYLQDRERFATGRGRYVDLPLIVLVNSGSASASEIVAGALKDHNRALVMGFQTFGKGSVQSIFELRNETGLRLTTAMYYTPSGASIQAFGITPHVRFNLPADQEEMFSYSESKLEGHLENNHQAKAPTPDFEIDAESVYKYFIDQGWIKEDRANYSDANDFLLVLTKRLLQSDDLSVPGMIDRAKKQLVDVPILPPPEKPVEETATAETPQ